MAYKSDRFLVWNMNRGYPTTYHISLANAVKEAERLAAANPGETFCVMAPVGSATVEKPAIYTPHGDWQQIPF